MTDRQIVEKHPLETIGLRFDFAAFLASVDEQMAAWDVAADIGLTISAATELNDVISCLVAGGENKRSYRVAADIRTSAGRVIRQEFLIRVRGEPVTGQPVNGTPTYVTVYVQPGYYAPGYFQGGT